MNGRPNNRGFLRRVIPYGVAVAVVGGIVAGLWPQPVPVEVTRVSRGPLRATVNEEGKTRIRQRYLVSAPVSGQMRRIPFKAGEPVVQGETVVAIIDPVSPSLLDPRSRAQAEARRDAMAANVDKAGAGHKFATLELRRQESLFADKTASAQELEAAQLRATAAGKELAAAEGMLRQAEAELQEFGGAGLAPAAREPVVLKAPVTGRVLKLFEESARAVTVGTPLMELGNPAELEVVVEALSRDGAVIAPGAKVEFEQWGGPKPLLGKVRLVEPAAFTKISALGVEEQRVNVVADLVTPPEERPGVGDNFRVEARIVVWETNDTLKVAAGALFRRGEQWAAFVVKDGRVTVREVKAGRSSGIETQVLEGLQEGDEVVLYPGSRVKDRLRVKIIKL